MITIVEQTLCHIKCGDMPWVVVVATIFLAQTIEDKLMLVQHINGQFVVFLQMLLDVVGIQYGEFACHGNILLAKRQQIGIGTDDDAIVAKEGADATQRFGVVYQGEVTILLKFNLWVGQIVLQSFSYANRTASRTSTAMRCGEGLVQIDVHDIEAHVARTAHAEHGVEVGSVVVHQTATIVHQSCYLWNLGFEDTQGVGVGHHHAGNIIAKQWFQVLNIHRTIGSTLHLHNLQTAHRSRSWISAVGRVGNDNLGTLQVATLFVIGADYHQTGQFSMSTGKGIQGELVKTGYLGERFLYVII